MAALLNANQELLDVFKCYGELEAATNAEQERTVTQRGRAEQTADTTVRAFRSRYITHLTSSQQFQYVAISDPTQTQAYSGSNGGSASSREPSPSRGAGRPSYSRDLPKPPSAYPAPTQPRYGHHHSQSNASVNNLMPPPPAPHGPRLAAARSRTPSPERGYAPSVQAPQGLSPVAASGRNAAAAPASSLPSSEQQYPMRHAPPPGPPPLHVHYPTTKQGRADSLPSIKSVSLQGHGAAPIVRVDVSAANSYATESDEEEIMTPIRPSEKALGKQRAPIDAEPDEEELRESLSSVSLLNP